MSYLELARSQRQQYERDERNEQTLASSGSPDEAPHERNENDEETQTSLSVLYERLRAIYASDVWATADGTEERSQIAQEIHRRKYAVRSAT